MKPLYLIFLYLLILGCERQQPKKCLNVAYPDYWGDELVPSLQHTVVGDAVLTNQFESLTYYTHGGQVVPLIAKSWSISENFKKFTFKINTNKSFSDGTPVTSFQIKKIWEYGLALEPKSSNSSLADVLNNVIGFEEFKNKKKLKGLKTPDAETLIVEYKKPFRTGLTNLSQTRMSIYKIKNGEYLGTGPYKLIYNKNKKAKFIRNKFNTDTIGFDTVCLSVLDVKDVQSKIETGKVDIFYFGEQTKTKCEDSNTIGCVRD